ncbi:MAG: hypothetical protein ABF246_01565 [Winogradskyella sp.]
MLQASPKKPTLNNVTLNLNESALLKTYALDYHIDEVLDILEIKADKYQMLFNQLSNIYDSNNFFEIISLAVKSKHINRYDLVKRETKEITKQFVDKIYDYIDSNEKNGLQDAIIFNLLKDYVKGIHELFKSNSNLNSEISLSNEQFSYLKHRLNHYNIYGTFKVNKSIETHLTTKFKTENFFNTVRRVFELNLFTLSDIDENYNEYKKKLDKKIKNKFISVKTLRKATLKEKKLYIYFDLIDYYNTLEDKFLSIDNY